MTDASFQYNSPWLNSDDANQTQPLTLHTYQSPESWFSCGQMQNHDFKKFTRIGPSKNFNKFLEHLEQVCVSHLNNNGYLCKWLKGFNLTRDRPEKQWGIISWKNYVKAHKHKFFFVNIIIFCFSPFLPNILVKYFATKLNRTNFVLFRGLFTWPNQDDQMNVTEPWQWRALIIEHDRNWNKKTLINFWSSWFAQVN